MEQSHKLYVTLICGALILATVIAFEPIRHNEFISYDDHTYIIGNEHVNSGLTPESIIWAFTTSHGSNWHPLTWLSHMIDIELFGPEGALVRASRDTQACSGDPVESLQVLATKSGRYAVRIVQAGFG